MTKRVQIGWHTDSHAEVNCRAKAENLKDNSTMDKTEAEIVSYGILYLNPSSHQCQPPYKHKIEALGEAILAC